MNNYVNYVSDELVHISEAYFHDFTEINMALADDSRFRDLFL